MSRDGEAEKCGVVFWWRQGNLTVMEVFETVQCPYCGQTFDIAVDTSVASQTFTTDCEVCCRPFEVAAESTPGEILSLDVREN